MDDMKINKPNKSKAFGAFLLIIGIFGVLVIMHRLSYYVYEYDPKWSPVDYGKFNVLSFFTIHSNILASVYLIIKAIAVFGGKKAQRIAFNPTFTLLVTTYILLAGIVYTSGFPLKMSPPLTWNTPYSAMHSFTQIFHHMIMPPLMVIIFLFPATDEKIGKKAPWIAGIYPLVYSLFSMARGALGKMHFYPYPFYRPEFFYNMIFKGRELNLPVAYILMIPALAGGIGIFIATAAILRAIYNKRIKEK